MNEREFQRRRKKAKEARIQQVRRQRLILAAVLAVVILLTVIIASCSGARKKAAEEAALAAEEAAALEAESANTEGSAAEEVSQSDAAGTEAAYGSGTDGTETEAAAGGTDSSAAAVTGSVLVGTTSASAVYTENGWVQTVPSINEGIDRTSFAADVNVPCGSDSGRGIKTVYLTLDDGPSMYTSEILDICDRYNIKITFFVSAEDPEYAGMIKEAYDRGHTIGLHTYTHDYSQIYASEEAYFADLSAIGSYVAEQIGYVPCFIRFPGGSSNYVSHDYCEGIMTALTSDVVSCGYQYYDWNCSSGDGGTCDVPEELAAAACSAGDYNTVVLLSHDSSAKYSTVQALPTIIEYYLSLGFEFQPLDRNAFYCHHETTN